MRGFTRGLLWRILEFQTKWLAILFVQLFSERILLPLKIVCKQVLKSAFHKTVFTDLIILLISYEFNHYTNKRKTVNIFKKGCKNKFFLILSNLCIAQIQLDNFNNKLFIHYVYKLTIICIHHNFYKLYTYSEMLIVLVYYIPVCH